MCHELDGKHHATMTVVETSACDAQYLRTRVCVCVKKKKVEKSQYSTAHISAGAITCLTSLFKYSTTN